MTTAEQAFQANAAAVVRDYYVEPRIGASICVCVECGACYLLTTASFGLVLFRLSHDLGGERSIGHPGKRQGMDVN